MRTSVLSVLVAGLGALAAAGDLDAQDVEMLGRVHGVRPPPGYYDVLARYPNAYQFHDVWKDVVQRVRQRRAELIAARDYPTLNIHFEGGRASPSAASAAGTAVSGTFRVPVLVGLFADSTHAAQPSTSDLDSLLFGTLSAPPYTVHTLYDELSSGLVDVQGDVIGWFTVDSAAAWYEGSNNGLSPSTDETGEFMKALLDSAEVNGVDFSQYDNDGDGRVDLVAFLHPLKGGECGSSHIWSHRWTYSAWHGSSYSTNDGVTANDYMIQPAVGGTSGCDSTQTMAIGTFSHELGHGMANLPDLYDTSGSTEGIGHWGLMGSGSWNRQNSPAHMMAWSKQDIGWVNVTVVDSSMAGSFLLPPVVDSARVVRVQPPTSNSEYFLLENRHALGSDANLHGEGLALWHIDSARVASRRGSNSVNASFPHGVDLEEADGANDLDNGSNRGDGGDIYPGSTNNTALGPGTTPNSDLNDGSTSGVQIDSITVNGDKTVAFRVNFNTVTELVTTSIGAGTEVIVDGATEPAPFQATWTYPSNHTIEVDSIQGDTLTRYVFQSWSDGGARSHSVSIDATPDTFTANLATEYRLKATSDITGSVSSSVSLDGSGVAWLAPASNAQLVATPDSGYEFVQWEGDTMSTADTLDLVMTKPYTVRARFGLPVTIDAAALSGGVMGAAYEDTLAASGGSGSYVWSLVGGDPLPTGLTLADSTGVISGVPEEEGTFELIVQAVSGALTNEDTLTLDISKPALLLDDVVNHLLSPVGTLNADEERFLDLIGNNNGAFDIGDFRAYLQDTGLVADIVPAELSESDGKARRGEDATARKEEG